MQEMNQEGPPSPTVQSSDLSARAKIREAALRLFAREGFGVSLRTVAEIAGVSPALVVHYFGTKEGLKAAVDQAVLRVFLECFDRLPRDVTADLLSQAMGEMFSEILGGSPEIRQYLRRSLLEATPAATTIFDEIVAATVRGLELLDRAGGLRPMADTEWRPYQVLAVILGPLLLEPVMQRHMREPVYSPDAVRRRTQANLEFVARGIFRKAGGEEGPPAPER